MAGIRYGITRYLQQEKSLKITDNEAFSLAGEAFSAVTTELKKLGKAKVNHHLEITKTDLQKLNSSFDITQSKDLLYKCLFDIVFFFVRRGREKLREHTKSTFAVAVDSQSRKHVYQN